MTKMSLGQRLYAERVTRGWSQAKAADFFGVTQPEISKWEAGRQSPKDMDKVAEFLRISRVDAVALKHGVRSVSGLEEAWDEIGRLRVESADLAKRVDELSGIVTSLGQVVEVLTAAVRTASEDRDRSATTPAADPPTRSSAPSRKRAH